MRLMLSLLEAIQDLELTKLNDPDEDILLAALEHHQVKLRFCGKLLTTITKLDKSALIHQKLQFIWYDGERKVLYVVTSVHDHRAQHGDYVVMREHTVSQPTGKHSTEAELKRVLAHHDKMLDLGSPKITQFTGIRVENKMAEIESCLASMDAYKKLKDER